MYNFLTKGKEEKIAMS